MDLKKEVLRYKWRRWLERRFNALHLSFFVDGMRREYFEKLGMEGIRWRIIYAQSFSWYENDEILDEVAGQFEGLLRKKTIYDLSNHLKNFYAESKPRIKALEHEKDIKKALSIYYDIITSCTSWIFATHALERVYKKRIEREVPEKYRKAIDKFVIPERKNSNQLLSQWLMQERSKNDILEEFAWLPTRDLHSRPLSEQDLDLYKNTSVKNKEIVEVPEEIKQIAEELKELTWMRTERTDYFYEFIYLSRPLFKMVAEHYNIPYREIEFYSIQSLISGKPIKYPEDATFANCEGEYIITDEKWLQEENVKDTDSIKGFVACKGYVRGRAKIVKWTNELDKVEEGDILIAPMTFPSFITAMKKASAFVTDEGGITCHAAIVAREMGKPCIIGTGNATKVLKDGDLVEVDADKGVVRRL